MLFYFMLGKNIFEICGIPYNKWAGLYFVPEVHQFKALGILPKP